MSTNKEKRCSEGKEVKYRTPDLNHPPPPDNREESASSPLPHNYDKVSRFCYSSL